MFDISLNKIWWWCASSLMQIVDTLGECFFFLVGSDSIANNSGSNVGNLLTSIFVGEDGNGIISLYKYVFFLGIFLFLFMISLSAIKAQFSKDVSDGLQKIGFRSLFAFIKMSLIPVVFFVALQATGVIFSFLINAFSEQAPSDSLAQLICDACAPEGAKPIYFNGNYEALKDATDKVGGTDSFSYMQCILASCFLMVTLVTVMLALIRRIGEIFFYYLAAPLVLAKDPLDEGKGFEQWKENLIAQMFSAGGIIICMYSYFFIVDQFTNTVDKWVQYGGNATVGSMLNILIIICGSFVPAQGSKLLAQLISQNAGQNEANSMMHAQQMMGNALHTAGLVGGKVLGSALTAGGSTAKGALGRLFAGKGSGGGGSGDGGTTNAVADAVTNATQQVPDLNSGSGAAAAANLTSAGAPAAEGATATPAAASVSDVPKADPRTKGLSMIGNAWKNSISGARNAVAKDWHNPAKQGFWNKTGTLLGAGASAVLGGAVGTVAGIGKGVANLLGGKRGAEKARHAAHNRQEKAKGKGLLSRFAAQNAGQHATPDKSGKWSSYNAAAAYDKKHGGTERMDRYIGTKMQYMESRSREADKKLTAFEKKNGTLSTEQKQQFMQQQLGEQYARYGQYLQAAKQSGHLSEQQHQQYRERFDKIGTSMGIAPTTPTEGGDKK